MGDKRALMLGIGAAAALLLAGAVWLGVQRDHDKYASCRQSAMAGGFGALGGAFELTDETGARVTDAQVFDRPSLLYFGYTYCPDVCPLDNARNAEAVDLLAEAGHEVRPVFVSVDPARDTPEVLREFTDILHPQMLGLTGSDDEIAAVNKLWRNYYKKNDEGDDEYYLVDHMTNTFLVMPEDGTVAFFDRDVTPADMADQVACFVQKQ